MENQMENMDRELAGRGEQTVAELLADAISHIPRVCPQWTDHNAHDPGITCLEMMAWLKEIQDFHIDATGEEHQRAYLKLAGGQVRRRRPGLVWITVGSEKEMILRRGTRFYAGDICFESLEDQAVSEGNFAGFVSGEGKNRREWTGEWLREGRGIAICPFGDGRFRSDVFTIRLKRPLTAETTHCLYMRFGLPEGISRIPVREEAFDAHGFYPLGAFRLEYRRRDGWARARLAADETYGMIQDGGVWFSLDSPMDRERPEMRLVLERSGFMVMPVITRISLAMVKAAQQETVVSPPLAEGTGFPNQVIDLEDSGICREDFELEAERPDAPGKWETWEKVENYYNSGPESRHYMLEGGVLRFGDGIRGMAPEGQIRVSGYVRTLGAGGNIKAGTIRVMDAEAGEQSPLTIINEEDVRGGEDEESPREAIERCQKEMEMIRRAVTCKDYELLVRQIPGLLIADCKAWARQRRIFIAVRPYAGNQRGVLNEAYEKNIYRYLEDRRMLGTRLKVVSPEYFEINVTCEAVQENGWRDGQVRMREAISAWFANLTFGCRISMSSLYKVIDALPCVKTVSHLYLDMRGRGKRTAAGDYELPPYGLAVQGRADCYVISQMDEW